MQMTWREAIVKVLSESPEALHYSEISDRILSQGYYRTEGATPADTVNAQISSSIKHEGETSPFIRVAKGTFALRSSGLPAMPPRPRSTAAAPQPVPSTPPVTAAAPIQAIEADEDEEASAIIRSFGMYWDRNLVVWRNDPKMFGKQQALAKAVDFGRQRGIYILYDHHTVVYVGRSIDRPLGRRLYEHTVDRLGSRWNRFSWFGLLDVTDEGDLRERPLRASLAVLVSTLEALLIEALEPPQNRRRGDDFSAIEYIQDVDPELKEREIRDTLRQIEQRLRGGGG